MSYSAPIEAIESLAANIGEAVYMDVAKWHLYLNDAKLHTLVAQRLYPLVEGDRISEAEITRILQDITVPLGAGRKQLPLLDLIPATCIEALIRALEDFQESF
ncbi:MAG: DUF3181 family protein [Leptolyngbya sp. SIO1E4]|nr:DUF3181 family protein [Leptolyngbya sp. SIO1E4]